MTRLLRVAVVFASVSASPNAAAAEPTIYMMVGGSPCTPAYQCRPPRIVEIDIGRGAIVAEHEIPFVGQRLSVTADGGYLFWYDLAIFEPRQLRIFNIPAKRSAPLRPWRLRDPVSHPSAVRAFAELERIALPATSGSTDAKLVFDPNGSAAYALTSGLMSSRFHVIATDRLALVASVVLPYDSSVFDMVMAPRPPPPVHLVATTTGRQVTLTWDAGPRSPALTHFLIDAGMTPGATDIVIATATAETALVVDAVPSGTYYVRVRAVNVAGPSGPSMEVAVTVA